MRLLRLTGTLLGVIGVGFVLTAACSGKGGGGNTGGKGNTGGGTTGGNGGHAGVDGGHAGAPVACANVATIDSADTLIADFECLPGPNNQKFDWFPWPNWDSWFHGAYWYYDSADKFDATYQNWSCLPTGRGGLAQPGHASANAGYVEARVPKTSYGAGFGIWMGGSPPAAKSDLVISCIDASAFKGISYWIKGENTGSSPANQYTVKIGTFDTVTASPAEGPVTCTTDGDGGQVCTGKQAGGCTAPKCDPYTFVGTIPSATDWTQVTLNWTQLVAPTTGVTAAFNPAKLFSIDFSADASVHGGTVAFYIDDIEWVGGGQSTLPRTCPASKGGATGAGGAPDYSQWQTAGAGGLSSLAACDGTPVAGGAGGAGP